MDGFRGCPKYLVFLFSNPLTLSHCPTFYIYPQLIVLLSSPLACCHTVYPADTADTLSLVSFSQNNSWVHFKNSEKG